MPDELSNDLQDVERYAIHTSKGSFLKVEDVKRLMTRQKVEEALSEVLSDPPRSLAQARARSREYLREQGMGPDVPDIGRAIPASDPQPSSRT